MTPTTAARNLTVFFAMLLASSPVRAQVLTLQQAEARALAYDHAIAEADARASGASAHARTVRAAALPILSAEVGASFGSGNQLVRIQDSEGRSTFVSGSRIIGEAGAFRAFIRHSAGIRIDALQYDFGRTAARTAGARADAAASEAELEAAREGVRDQVRAAYVAWLAAYERRRMTEEAVRAGEARADQVDEAAQAGSRAGADRDVVAYDVARLRLERSRALASEDDARYLLAELIGAPIARDLQPDVSMLEASEALPEVGTVAATVRALELRRDAVAALLRLRRRRHSPVLSGTLRLGVSGLNEHIFPTYQAQVLFTVPLWDPRNGGSVHEEVSARIAELDARHHALLEAMATHDERAAGARAHAEDQVSIAEEMRALAQRANVAAEERHRSGALSIDGLLAARDRVLEAESQLLEARLARLIARFHASPAR